MYYYYTDGGKTSPPSHEEEEKLVIELFLYLARLMMHIINKPPLKSKCKPNERIWGI